MKKIILFSLFVTLFQYGLINAQPRTTEKFNSDWKFFLGDNASAFSETFNDNSWRKLNLPHDWSIELPFDSTSPTGNGGGALRGGLAWYRKTFALPVTDNGKNIFIDFDGVYRNSQVFINGRSLGIRPNGYISFRYDLTPYLKFGSEKNILAVKVDNSQQPNSRWYSGSGIYRNVWLVKTGKVYVDNWGTYISTPVVSAKQATVKIRTTLGGENVLCDVITTIINKDGKIIATQTQRSVNKEKANNTEQEFTVDTPVLWSIENPYLYKANTKIVCNGKVTDEYSISFGIRYYRFDADDGFFLNDKHVKILGVCNHHDLGCLGTAINYRALERQLQIMKAMGVNGIRTSHNPPAPELLELCDKMGFIVMDEAFDMWKRGKTKYDYSIDFEKWFKKDLEDQVLRDRNHPSVFIWSIGNEIPEQWGTPGGKDSSGRTIAKELSSTIHALDTTRPITSALNNPWPGNEIYKSGALDLVGFNYNHREFKNFPTKFPGQKFIGSETVSALQSRGHYDMPSDSIRRWPSRWDKPVQNANADLTCSAYENCSAPWGSTHEETLKELLKYDFASGMFIWTGFDYIGEPTPYPFPARSSYFGIIDLAGFPKDVYYLYQSLFTNKNVLHLFPHWNWKDGQTIDLWAYYNNADEVELYINGKSQGIKKKAGDDLHVMWRVIYEPGTVKAVSTKNGKIIAAEEIKTAGAAAKIILQADRYSIKANGEDLSFITIKVEDKGGNLVPDASNLVKFTVTGDGFIAGVDNGYQADLSSFKADYKKAFNGLCLAVLQSTKKEGTIKLTATSDGLQPATITVVTK